MVVLAPGTEIRAADIPPDILEGPNSLLPVRVHPPGGEVGAQELEFIFRSIMELRMQVRDLQRRVDERPERVQVIDLGDDALVADVLSVEPDGAEEVIYRPGMTMAEVEKVAIEAALRQANGNRRRAAEDLGIGERTLYRKIKAYHLG